MKKIIILASLALLAILVIAFGLFMIMLPKPPPPPYPLGEPSEQIREYMLEITPFGTEMKDVIKIVKDNEQWKLEWVDENNGYGIDDDGRPGELKPHTVGEKSMRAYAQYQAFFETYVVVYWGFDEDSKLIDIAVRKDIDGV